MPQMQHRIQRWRNTLGYVKQDVTSRVATTISSIRDKSYAYAGFPTRPPGSQDELADQLDVSRARYATQLQNTIVRYV